ncbi:unnamed protein product [Fraxinus pennsylvanica]|uniref:BHLH domain-containing protein n=1 Tax=Fraxinus pennsylvanica TaxID=56036 RepID=A0AAD1YYR0_9LAMI|nr:unnamed protein product [Fraxinus pennsylvanica]
MRNAILPLLSSHLYSNGYNDALSNIIPAQIDSYLNSYDSSFCMDLDMQNHHSRFDEVVSMYSQSYVDYISSGLPLIMPMERLDCPPFVEERQSTCMPICDINNICQPHGKTFPVQQSENVWQSSLHSQACFLEICSDLQPTNYGRKRSVEARDQKHKKAMCFQQDMEGEKIQRQKVLTRRSQKLTDKITALQKLVSPYGKTDTASVLQEAYVFIKLLQDQIQNLVNTSHANDESTRSMETEKEVDLRRKGLCVVPVSCTQRLLEEVNDFLPEPDLH